MQITISEMTRSELPETVDAVVSSFGPDWRNAAEADFAASFADYPYRPRTFVAKNAGKVIGTLQSLQGYIDFNLRTFAWLSVLPEYRRRGFGRTLMSHGEADAARTQFGGKSGTFLLISGIGADYYQALGYAGESVTQAGNPIMVKHFHGEN
jgi:predicted N-acetyltransferase YhbS